jgi:hypothetical protein
MTQETDRAAAMPAESPRRAARLRLRSPVTAVLPIAAPVAHGGAGSPAPRRRRALVILGIAAAVLLCAAGIVFFGVRGAPQEAGQNPGSDISVDAVDAPRSVNALLGEGGGSPTDLPTHVAPTPVLPPSDPVASPTVEPADPTTAAPGSPVAGGTAPAPGEVSGPSTPSGPSAPSAPPPAAAPRPLAFTGLTENSTIGLLGIRLFSSDTLSLSGQPGSTATVSYGSTPAGSVTFDGAGRATLTVGGSVVDLGLGDPVITAAYSDGTAGSPIQARRSTI